MTLVVHANRDYSYGMSAQSTQNRKLALSVGYTENEPPRIDAFLPAG